MATKLKIKKGDRVEILTGRAKGARGEVERVIKGKKPGDHRVVVSGANMVKRHTRPTPQEQGGIIERPAPVHISNVALLDPKSDKPTKVGYKTLEDGRKVRFARGSGEIIDR
jgi:large subunit ribosomal protein L24